MNQNVINPETEKEMLLRRFKSIQIQVNGDKKDQLNVKNSAYSMFCIEKWLCQDGLLKMLLKWLYGNSFNYFTCQRSGFVE
jgi:hypothetical protein